MKQIHQSRLLEGAAGVPRAAAAQVSKPDTVLPDADHLLCSICAESLS
ncbi:hypothetical protein ABZ465_22750 [Streptomyces griseoincarnatus]